MGQRLSARLTKPFAYGVHASFTYREGGLKGILLASRLSGLAPNLTARFTPGTLISSYEVYEALRRGVAVP